MIDKLRPIAIFAAVVEQGSFRAAAKHLGLAPSRISETVSGLEAQLGVTLLYRSTRQLSLTAAGRTLHAQAELMLRALEDGLDAINPETTEARGTLNVTAPAFVTQTWLMDAFAAFQHAHPRVEMAFDFDDRQRDLLRDGFDMSIRAGWLADSSNRARAIGTTGRLLVANPGYAARHAVPTHPSDLESWNWVGFSIRPDLTELTSDTGEVVEVKERRRVSVTSASALYEFAVRGLGVTSIPEDLARRGLARGDLIHILPNWHLSPLGIYAVWPNQVRRETLTVLFARFLGAFERST